MIWYSVGESVVRGEICPGSASPTPGLLPCLIPLNEVLALVASKKVMVWALILRA